MNGKSVLLATLLSSGPSVASAGTTLVDFDAIDATGGPVNVGTHYQPQGVIFDDLFVRDISNDPFYQSGPGAGTVSNPNVGSINDEFPFSLSVAARFVTPSGTPTVTSHVEFEAYDGNEGTTLVTVTAFDVNQVIVFGPQTFITPQSNVMTVSVSAPDIHRIRLETDTDGTGIDNFRFTTIPLPIETATWGEVKEQYRKED